MSMRSSIVRFAAVVLCLFAWDARGVCNPLLQRETPDSDFRIEAGGHVVSHPRTGLSWRRCQLGMEWDGVTCSGIAQSLSWQNALLAVQSINQGGGIAGQHDWRLPDLNELLTLVDHGCHDPAINANVFPNTAFPTASSDIYWSATPNGSAGLGWAVRFQFGDVLFYPLGNSLRVRPVRGQLDIRPDGVAPPVAPPSYVEGFDDLDALNALGWGSVNLSEPLGEGRWVYGDNQIFSAHSGSAASLLTVNFDSTADRGTISNWLLTPYLQFGPGATLSFWTRTASGALFADRLQVRLCQGDSCSLPASGAEAVGAFGTLLLDINANLDAGPDPSGLNGYPDQWTRFEVTAAQGLPASGRGRIAFRYYVADGGFSGTHSNYIGIDSLRLDAAQVVQ